MARKNGLGRGLESLLGETAGEVGDSRGNDETTLDIQEIHPNSDQPRKDFDQEALSELAESISRNGLLQPILVRPHENGYQIVAGERRYQAAKLAGLDEVPVVIREVSDEDVLVLALVENLQRTDLNPMEEALGYQTLMNQKGLTQEQLAEAVSKSRSGVANSLRLLRLPPEVQEWVREGLLTPGHARAVLSVSDDDKKLALARRAIDEGLSVRQTETLASLVSGGIRRSTKDRGAPQPEQYQRASQRLSKVLDTKVRVREVRGKHKIEIEFTTDEDLARLLDRFEAVAHNDNEGMDYEV